MPQAMVGIRPPAEKPGRARIPRISWTMLKMAKKGCPIVNPTELDMIRASTAWGRRWLQSGLPGHARQRRGSRANASLCIARGVGVPLRTDHRGRCRGEARGRAPEGKDDEPARGWPAAPHRPPRSVPGARHAVARPRERKTDARGVGVPLGTDRRGRCREPGTRSRARGKGRRTRAGLVGRPRARMDR